MNIDWSTSPEGATHYYPGFKAWYKFEGDQAFLWYEHRRDWVGTGHVSEYEECMGMLKERSK